MMNDINVNTIQANEIKDMIAECVQCEEVRAVIYGTFGDVFKGVGEPDWMIKIERRTYKNDIGPLEWDVNGRWVSGKRYSHPRHFRSLDSAVRYAHLCGINNIVVDVIREN